MLDPVRVRALEMPREPAAQEAGPLRAALDDIDPDALSPREALDVLYKLKDIE